MRTQQGTIDMRRWKDFQPLWKQIASHHDSVSGLTQRELSSLYQTRAPHIELVDENDAYWLHVTTPDIRQDDITVTVDDSGMLILQGEQLLAAGSDLHNARPYSHRAFTRRFVLQQPVRKDTISTVCIDGKLSICIPKVVDRQVAQPVLALV